MELQTISLRQTILATALLLSCYGALCMYSKGETLAVKQGIIEKCELLGGGQSELISHATIRTESGAYLISSITDCETGAAVNIFIKRGILYFNSVFAAEKAWHDNRAAHQAP